MALYSPLDIHLYDSAGNHTGPAEIEVDGDVQKVIEKNIPNSYYDVFGGHKYVGWGLQDDVRVELEGYDNGAYTIELQEIAVTGSGEEVTTFTTLKDLPTSAQTAAAFSVPRGGLAEMTVLTADYDGDGVADYEVIPQANSIVAYVSEETEEQASDKGDDASGVVNDKDDASPADVPATNVAMSSVQGTDQTDNEHGDDVESDDTDDEDRGEDEDEDTHENDNDDEKESATKENDNDMLISSIIADSTEMFNDQEKDGRKTDVRQNNAVSNGDSSQMRDRDAGVVAGVEDNRHHHWWVIVVVGVFGIITTVFITRKKIIK